MTRLSAHDLIDLVLDDGSWCSWDTAPVRDGISEEYAAELAAAAEKSGVDESVLTGEARMHGRRIAVLVGEFGFLAGSIGRAAADRIVAGIERATREGLPLVAAPVSGGTRMQEGTPAFVQMVRISAAVAAHRTAGLPYLVYLRHPTTGGVMASWGSLGHVTVAEPGALVGFLGPRVYEALYDKPFPEGVQTSENLYARGIVDAVLPPEEIKEILDRALTILMAAREGVTPVPDPGDDDIPDVDTWDCVTRSRRPDRPGVRRLLRYAASDVVPLNGTGQGEQRPGAAHRAGALRRGAVRLPRAGPPRPDHRPPDGSRGPARGPARDAAGVRARPTARDGHRHPGGRTVGRRRERRARR